MQNWALQQVLLKLGHTPVTIDRGYNYPRKSLLFRRCLSLLKCLVYKYLFGRRELIICNPFAEVYITKRDLQYDISQLQEFVRSNVAVSPKKRSSKALCRYIRRNDIDCVLVGSDQVWREEYSPYIEDYFLGFLPENSKIRKVAYAASFGVSENFISEKHLYRCISLASNFDALSVREESGVKIMKDVFGLKAKQVLDPTLLLSADEYLKLIESKDIINGGLVTYILDENDEKSAIINSIGKPVKQMTISPPHYKNGDKRQLVSISEWLGAFAGASFVITDSFHGCVFSIIFKKPFIVIANRDRGLDRFNSLLNQLHVKDRLILNLDEFLEKHECFLSPINYTQVCQCLDVENKDSLEYLKAVLEL